MVSLGAQAPHNFETSFTEQYGSQELSSIPVDAGASKTVKLKVRPPNTIGASRYPVSVKASRRGRHAPTPTSRSRSPASRSSTWPAATACSAARAEAGKEATIPIVDHQHRHRAGRRDRADQQRAERLEDRVRAQDHRPHRARTRTRRCRRAITPPEKAIAGDYAPTFNAASRGETASTQFRVAVTTSTMWGIVGAGIIAIALLIMVGAVARFGRR